MSAKNMTKALSARAKALARTALRPLPLDFWERLFPKDLIALCYHVVSDERLPHVRLSPYKNIKQFEDDLKFVAARTVSYRQVVEHRLGNRPLPPNSVLITFDDGFAECYDVVRPALLKHGVDAVFFVPTEFVDDRTPFFECALSLGIDRIMALSNERAAGLLGVLGIDNPSLKRSPKRYQRAVSRLRESRIAAGPDEPKGTLLLWLLGAEAGEPEIERACALLEVNLKAFAARRPLFMSSKQVRQLAADGFTVGAHGLNHRSLEGRDPGAIEAEIVASCEAVRAISGQARVPFAFPYRGLGVDRGILRGVLQRNRDVELIFDSGCLRRDAEFVVNRVFTDAPPRTPESNVPSALRSAWSTPSAWFR